MIPVELNLIDSFNVAQYEKQNMETVSKPTKVSEDLTEVNGDHFKT